MNPWAATIYDRVMHPRRRTGLLAKCDGVLLCPGASTGADNDVRIATGSGGYPSGPALGPDFPKAAALA